MIYDMENLTYTYIVYGLKIASEVKLSELKYIKLENHHNVDVTIIYGKVPQHFYQNDIEGRHFKISKNEFYFHIKGTARYYVTNGNKITIEPELQFDFEELKVFLLGTCFGVLLTQRNIIAIHGGSVAISGQGVVITGHTGAGKSTLTAALRKDGFSFLSDDVTALGQDSGSSFIVFPTYPQQRLCKDTMTKIGYKISEFQIVDSHREKYLVPIGDNFLNEVVPLRAMYEIIVDEDCTHVQMIELTGSAKLKAIISNIYRVEISSIVGFDISFIKQCINLAKEVPMYRIIRPKDGFTVETQIGFIKESLNLLV